MTSHAPMLSIPECSSGHARGITPAISTPTLPVGLDPFVTVDRNQTGGPSRDEGTAYLQGFAPLTRIPLSPGG